MHLHLVMYGYPLTCRPAGGVVTPIAGATSKTFAVTDALVGKILRAEVSFEDDGGTTETVASRNIRVTASTNTAPTGLPTITGTATVRETLTVVTSSIMDANGVGTFRYRWRANGADITRRRGTINFAETGETLVITSAEVGRVISVRVTYTDDGATDETLTSAPPPQWQLLITPQWDAP